ncbi:MAG: hypothetical protein RIS47_1277 [Bacteroidota bacterium]|jgi:hypothetical protein
MKKWILILLLSQISTVGFSQEVMRADTSLVTGYMVPMILIDGQWVLHVRLGQITILPPVVFRNAAQQKRYSKMEYNIRKVYPYAVTIQGVFESVNRSLDTIKGKRAQKNFVDKQEAMLKAQFEGKLRKLTFTQGRLLLKLVDRQTGHTTYEVVKQLKGGFSAFFWQSVARIFGANLKSEYDVKGDDWMIEDIISRLENGQI